nr:hypothetical protein [Tanacetum cinerariifolium]
MRLRDCARWDKGHGHMGVLGRGVGTILVRIRECRGVACGLKIVMRRREDCIGELKAVVDCEGDAAG